MADSEDAAPPPAPGRGRDRAPRPPCRRPPRRPCTATQRERARQHHAGRARAPCRGAMSCPSTLRPERRTPGAEDAPAGAGAPDRPQRPRTPPGRPRAPERARPFAGATSAMHGQRHRQPIAHVGCERPPERRPGTSPRKARRAPPWRRARALAAQPVDEARELVEGVACESGRSRRPRGTARCPRRSSPRLQRARRSRRPAPRPERGRGRGSATMPEREEDPRAHPRIRRRGEARAAVRRPDGRRPAAHHGRARRTGGEPGR